MRILLVTSMVPDPDGIGAIPKLLAAQLEGLSAQHRVTLVSTYGDDPGQAEAAARLLDSGCDAHILDRRRPTGRRRRWRVRAELASSWATHPWPWRVVCGAGGVQSLLDRVAREREFDVIAVEDNPMAVLRYPAGIPTVLTEHEAIRAPLAEPGPRTIAKTPRRAIRELDWRRWDRFLPSAWRRFDLLQVFSEADAAAIRARVPELAAQVRVNPYGMILPRPSDHTREREETILFSGTFAHPPNREAASWLARTIMPEVWRARPQARLQIVGRAPTPEIHALAGARVEVIADPPTVAPYLAEAALVLAPVRSGGGMRMKVLEAMALAKAVVTTPLGAEGFTALAPNPPLAIADDAPGLAHQLDRLLAAPEERRQLGHAARAFAERWHSPSAWAQRLESVYDEAIEDRRSGVPA